MIRVLLLAVILLPRLLAAENEPAEFSSATIEDLGGYQFMPLANLKPVPLPKGERTKEQATLARLKGEEIPRKLARPAIPEARRTRLEMATRRMALRFGVVMVRPLQCSDRGDGKVDVSTLFNLPKDDYFSAEFDAADQPVSFYCRTQSGLPLDGVDKVTPDAFGDYARECHRLAFGFSPDGALSMAEDGRGLAGRWRREEAKWELLPAGVVLNDKPVIRADCSQPGFSLSGFRGTSAARTIEIRNLMDYRTTVSREQAAMIAWKNWRRAVPSRDTRGGYRILCRLRECTAAELNPWCDTDASQGEKAAWLDTGYEGQPSDGVCYEVQILDGLFRVSVLVDRLHGRILRMNQHRMIW